MSIRLLDTEVVDENSIKKFYGNNNITTLHNAFIGKQEKNDIIVGKFLSMKRQMNPNGFYTVILLVKDVFVEHGKSFQVILFGGLVKDFEKCSIFIEDNENLLILDNFTMDVCDERGIDVHFIELRSVINKSSISVLLKNDRNNQVMYDVLINIHHKVCANVFCIVNKVIKGLCYTSNKINRHAMYAVIDSAMYEQNSQEDFTHNSGFMDFPIHVFLNSPQDKLPHDEMEAGDILRITGLTGELYQKKRIFGIVNSSSQLTVFRKDINRNILPVSGDPCYIYSVDDQKTVSTLHKWWIQMNGYGVNDCNININDLVKKGYFFHLICQVVDLRCYSDENVTILRVTDGTPTPFSTKKYDFNSYHPTYVLIPSGSMSIDVCVYNPQDVAAKALKGMFIHLNHVCSRPDTPPVHSDTENSVFLEMVTNYSKITFLDEYIEKVSLIKEKLSQTPLAVSADYPTTTVMADESQTNYNANISPDKTCESKENSESFNHSENTIKSAQSQGKEIFSDISSKKQSDRFTKKRKANHDSESGHVDTSMEQNDSTLKYTIECSTEVDATLIEFISDKNCEQATMEVMLAGSYVRANIPCKQCRPDCCLHDFVHGICQLCQSDVSSSSLRDNFPSVILSTEKFLNCPNHCPMSKSLPNSLKPIFVFTLFLKDPTKFYTIQLELTGHHASRFLGTKPSFSWVIQRRSKNGSNILETLHDLEKSEKTFNVCLARKKLEEQIDDRFLLINTKLVRLDN